MASLTRSPVAALVSLALILVLGLGLGLGLGVGLATSDASACKALADAVAANLDARLEDKDTFALALASAEMPGLVVVGASPASADEAACEQATPAVNVRVAFSLDGAVEGIVSSEKKQEKLHDAVALAMGVTSQDLAISVTPGSLNVEAIYNIYFIPYYDKVMLAPASRLVQLEEDPHDVLMKSGEACGEECVDPPC